MTHHFDLKSGEVYGALVYQDAETVILRTEGRESQLSAAEFAEILSTDTNWGLEFARFHAVPGEASPEDQIRAGELARYAAGNGGQILDHREPPKPPSAARMVLRRLKGAFTPPSEA